LRDEERLTDLLAFFKALSDENRLKIVGLLAQRPYTVEKLADALGLSVSTTSHHLARLANAGLVTVRVDRALLLLLAANGEYKENDTTNDER
jgi:Predicted transcriptional regulator